MMKFKLNKNIRLMSIVTVIFIILLLIIMCIDLIPLMENVIKNIKDETAVVNEINGFGVKGIVIMMSLSILQVFSVVIPSTPIQILTGLTFGVFRGYIITILGLLLSCNYSRSS